MIKLHFIFTKSQSWRVFYKDTTNIDSKASPEQKSLGQALTCEGRFHPGHRHHGTTENWARTWTRFPCTYGYLYVCMFVCMFGCVSLSGSTCVKAWRTRWMSSLFRQWLSLACWIWWVSWSVLGESVSVPQLLIPRTCHHPRAFCLFHFSCGFWGSNSGPQAQY